ncbi:hypothetical protein [Leucobacter chromiireducens]|uniref:hypothetical protein n=1 Tax=Leucobacter chromiireducens TaxID=283877 RepID=UPI003F81033A
MKNKKILAAGAIATLGVGVATGITLGPGNTEPAQAAAGDIVCDIFHGGIRNLQVVQSGDRTFEVTYVDQNTLAGQDTTPGVDDRYAPLPAEFRDATNRITLGDAVAASALRVSQSVVTGPASDPSQSDWQVDQVIGNEAAPWESAALAHQEITWVHDVDARTVVTNGVVGEQVRPSDFPLPWLLSEDSTSVLQFTLTVPDDATGTVPLITSLAGSFVTTAWSQATWTWSKDQDVEFSTPVTCSVEFEDESTDPGTTDPGTTDPGTTEPGTTDPGTTEPGTTDPGTTDPGTTDPGTTEPGTTDAGTTDSGTTSPNSGKGTATELARTGSPMSPSTLGFAAGALLLVGAGLLTIRRIVR